MTAIQAISWAISIAVIAAASRFGRAPERWGALAILSNYLATAASVALEAPGFRWGVAIADTALAAALIVLSMIYRRHWLILAGGVGLLVVVSHASVFVDSGIGSRAYIIYRLGPGVLLLVALGLAPIERWLAGER